MTEDRNIEIIQLEEKGEIDLIQELLDFIKKANRITKIPKNKKERRGQRV